MRPIPTPGRPPLLALASALTVAVSIAGPLVSTTRLDAADWPRFRGPGGQGISTETGVPLEWAADRNIRFRTPIPGEGWSSPVIAGNRVYLTTVTDANTRARVLCLDAVSGQVLWNTEVTEIVPLRKESKNSYATPTPVVADGRVHVVFGDGTLAALDLEGKLLWKDSQTRFYSRHGLGASPLVHEGLFIMTFDGSNRVEKAGDWPNNSEEEQLGWRIPWDRAEIVALDAATGKRVWTARRGKSRIAHVSAAIVTPPGGFPQLVSPAGDAIQGFDPRTGERLWTVYSQGEGVTPSFAHGNGLIFTSSGFEKTTIRTVRHDATARGDVTATHVAWEQRKGTPTQPSFLFVSPHLYSITDGGIVHCYQANSGELVYAERVGGNHSASPVHAEGRIYFLSETGETTVIQAGPEFRILARNPLNEKCQASIAIANGRIYIRTERHLYGIGQGS